MVGVVGTFTHTDERLLVNAVVFLYFFRIGEEHFVYDAVLLASSAIIQ